jgi:hypothetical protein
VHIDPIKPTLKAPGTKRLKLNMSSCFQFCYNFAFKYNLRRYTKAHTELLAAERAAGDTDADAGAGAGAGADTEVVGEEAGAYTPPR